MPASNFSMVQVNEATTILVASKVSESSQHFGNKFSVVPGLQFQSLCRCATSAQYTKSFYSEKRKKWEVLDVCCGGCLEVSLLVFLLADQWQNIFSNTRTSRPNAILCLTYPLRRGWRNVLVIR